MQLCSSEDPSLRHLRMKTKKPNFVPTVVLCCPTPLLLWHHWTFTTMYRNWRQPLGGSPDCPRSGSCSTTSPAAPALAPCSSFGRRMGCVWKPSFLSRLIETKKWVGSEGPVCHLLLHTGFVVMAKFKLKNSWPAQQLGACAQLGWLLLYVDSSLVADFLATERFGWCCCAVPFCFGSQLPKVSHSWRGAGVLEPELPGLI